MPKSNQGKQKMALKNTHNIYLDYAASVDANPSSIHRLGQEARRELEKARSMVANVLNVRESEIIFTSGGTEGNNMAIQGVVWAWHEKNPAKTRPHVVTTNIEHPSVLETFKMLEKRGLVELTVVPVEADGIIDVHKLGKSLKSNTILVSVMYANNEIGTIQPVREIAKAIRRFRKFQKSSHPTYESSMPILHTDAVQAVNYLDVDVGHLGVDLLTLSGSKIDASNSLGSSREGVSGVGVLYRKNGLSLAPLYYGGDQEMGTRPGTENLKDIIKLADALRRAQASRGKESARLKKLRDYFIRKLEKTIVPTGMNYFINGDEKSILPSIISVTIPNIPSDLLVVELQARGVFASSKSACKSKEKGGSHVIRAIHPDLDAGIGGVRFSMGKRTKKSDIDHTIHSLDKILEKLKKWYTPIPIPDKQLKKYLK